MVLGGDGPPDVGKHRGVHGSADDSPQAEGPGERGGKCGVVEPKRLGALVQDKENCLGRKETSTEKGGGGLGT